MLTGLTLYSLGLLIYCIHHFIAAIQQEGGFSKLNAFSGLESLHLRRWPAICFSAILPVQWTAERWRQWRHSRLRQAGRCIHCKYNLTDNVSGVCPECGTPFTLA